VIEPPLELEVKPQPRRRFERPPAIPVTALASQPKDPILNVSLHFLNSVQYLSLSIHYSGIKIEDYLRGIYARIAYPIPIELEMFRSKLEELIDTCKMKDSLLDPKKILRRTAPNLSCYLFSFEKYQQIGEMMNPYYPPNWAKRS
jgi:hypothetical protein